MFIVCFRSVFMENKLSSCEKCALQPGKSLRYRFTDEQCLGLIYVTVPLSVQPVLLHYEVWWRYVAPEYVKNPTAVQIITSGYNMMRQLYPRLVPHPVANEAAFLDALQSREEDLFGDDVLCTYTQSHHAT